jgi:hypothetical protein
MKYLAAAILLMMGCVSWPPAEDKVSATKAYLCYEESGKWLLHIVLFEDNSAVITNVETDVQEVYEIMPVGANTHFTSVDNPDFQWVFAPRGKMGILNFTGKERSESVEASQALACETGSI